jgi:hypothetical protein
MQPVALVWACGMDVWSSGTHWRGAPCPRTLGPSLHALTLPAPPPHTHTHAASHSCVDAACPPAVECLSGCCARGAHHCQWCVCACVSHIKRSHAHAHVHAHACNAHARRELSALLTVDQEAEEAHEATRRQEEQVRGADGVVLARAACAPLAPRLRARLRGCCCARRVRHVHAALWRRPDPHTHTLWVCAPAACIHQRATAGVQASRSSMSSGDSWGTASDTDEDFGNAATAWQGKQVRVCARVRACARARVPGRPLVGPASLHSHWNVTPPLDVAPCRPPDA